MLVSSGAIAAGLAPLGLAERPRDLARQQAAASVGQGLLVARYTASFARYGRRVGQVLLTSDDTSRRAHYRNAYRTLDQLLAMGAVPVVNENDTVATDEIRFGDNDRLAALVAHLVRADLLVLLSDVDGLYDGDPATPGTSPHRRGRAAPRTWRASTSAARARPGVGTGGMVTKVEAARIAAAAGVPVVLTSAVHAADALAGARDRHVLPPHRPPLRRPAAVARARLHARAGALTLDDGRRAGRRRARAARCCPPGSPASRATSPPATRSSCATPDGPGRGPRARQLRRQGDPAAARPLHPRAGPGAGPGLRAGGRPPGRPGAAAS